MYGKILNLEYYVVIPTMRKFQKGGEDEESHFREK